MPQGPIEVALSAGVPAGAKPVNAASGNQANAVAAASLPAVAGKTNYLTGFDLNASGATAALIVEATVSGVTDGPLTYVFTFPIGVAVPAAPLSIRFNPPLKASAADTAITVSLPAGGSGNTNATANAYGYYA